MVEIYKRGTKEFNTFSQWLFDSDAPVELLGRFENMTVYKHSTKRIEVFYTGSRISKIIVIINFYAK